MLKDEKAAPISAGARACHIAFERCLQSASHPMLGVRQYSYTEDQMARFSIWTSNMAVFAAWRFSLDYRLREADDVQRLMLGMLEVLKGRISECVTFISTLPDTQYHNLQVSSMQVHADFERLTTALASQVGLFHEVSNVIRKASRQTQNEIAASSFRIRDQEGNDLENVLQGFLDRNIRDRFPHSNSIIRERLASTMVLRRRRILYRRARYATTSIEPQQTPTDPTRATSHVHSISKSATTLNTDNFRRAYSPSAVSSASYISVGASQDWVFPSPPPTPEDPSVEVTCPYCLYVLPGHEFQNETRWKKHVLADLDPLVCLFDHCDEPQVLYSHRKDWLQHMHKHTERWHCKAKSHGLRKFGTFEKFLLHMKDDHTKNYNDSQIDLLAERGIQSDRQLFEICPLCGISEKHDSVTQGNMIRHIMGHLRSLALKSLPPLYLENDDAVPDDEDNSQQTRSTIKNFASDNDGPSSFDWLLEPESPSLDVVTRDGPHTIEFRNSPWEDLLQTQATTSQPILDPGPSALSDAIASPSENPQSQPQEPERRAWETYETKIRELYAKHTLKTVREIMEREDGFVAS
ncbi:hypothetical protein PFICI_09079 [Pestalotiopsis fici W106-1]|uniref:Uncharacterized protein n=1 Tax=Pestalotiopsis fici (strain W106-1 / CGMCC3.15140) TaxID=1229662 RepID=W3X250_PESFW|nr:uncharacterized protein PFICI_09079 [Pestalotiopsis fici W106-1]ETS79226.1 hypothetical protein PFICI_09079 [Pestalotiopsis fici W106-1]